MLLHEERASNENVLQVDIDDSLIETTMIAGILPDSVEPGRDSVVEIVRGRLQLFTNKQLLTRLKTKKMARPTGLAQIALGRSSGLRPVLATLERPKRSRVLSNNARLLGRDTPVNRIGPTRGPISVYWRARQDSNL